MTDAISNSGPLNPSHLSPTKSPVQGLKSPAPVTEEDILQVESAAKLLEGEPDFDVAKVEAIKQAIADGNYPLDPKRIAESFAAFEKLVDSAVSPDPYSDR